MTDDLALLSTVVRDIMDRHRLTSSLRTDTPGEWDIGLWKVLEEAGLTALGSSQADAGAHDDLAAAEVVWQAGRFAARVPVADTVIASAWLRNEAELPYRPGPAVALPLATGTATHEAGRWTFNGQARRVPWAPAADRLIVAAPAADSVAVVDIAPDVVELDPNVDMAGNPVADVVVDGLVVDADQVSVLPANLLRRLQTRSALGRVLLSAGALERVFEITLRQVRTREQFGRPLLSFQAVSQQIAVLAGEVVVARGATSAATQSSSEIVVCAARVRTIQAAMSVARIAHQLHGAIGLTMEYELQQFTRHLWSWNEQFGALDEWLCRLGDRLDSAGASDDLWALVRS